MTLTDTFVRKLKHKGGSGEKYSDGGGMYLHVTATGKYWRLGYRFGGKQKLLAMGVYPEVSLAKARKRREEAREQLADGIDPAEARREKERAHVAETVNTFSAVAMEWHAMRAKRGEAATTTGKRLAHLETHVLPEIGSRPIADLKPSEVLAMLNKVVDGGSAYTATRLREICGQIFRYAIATDRADRNPAGDLRGALEVPRVKHRPALTTRREFGEFLRNLLTYENCQPMTRLAARLAVLTWTRPVELRTARWEHFDLEAKEWRVPAANMKEGKHLQAHTVPLSAQALSVLAELRALNGERVAWLFPGNHGADSIMSENTLNLLFKRMGYEGKQSHHGLRASARSLLSERGWSAAALETQLDHAERSKVVAAYARSEHLVERRKIMDDWGELVAAMESGSNVVPLRPAA
ncbi:tyrosine-type recombinase/integrase [Pseudorhodoferax sp.]|uniref:tyrosine-type recombinase/integrase n=1 Tax=Pseudorhodoferax sp. TaxID=1993553 RepID=UPI002DD685D2|nr:integrase arm-type DNA-binding domain-containing protein [Pseudorhodoferax sp.]